MIIQFHAITGYTGVLLNRDDRGLAKRLLLGGDEKVRVSSQCQKKRWRTSVSEYALSNVDTMSVRSRDIFIREIAQPLVAEGLDKTKVVSAALGVQETLYGVSEKARKALEKKKGDATVDLFSYLQREEIVILGRVEIEYLKDIVRRAVVETETADEAGVKAAQTAKDERAVMKALRNGAGLDAAMFGRMVTGDKSARIDAPVHVAHAHTIATAQVEPEYFTATDDLDPQGAGHVGVTELTSGLFYHYVVIDVPGLVSNIEGVSRADWMKDGVRDTAARLIENMIMLMATESLGAKKGSTAPYATADLVFVQIGDQLQSLSNAFRTPVRDDLSDAARAMAGYLKAKDDMLGRRKGIRLMSTIADTAFPDTTKLPLVDLAEKVREAVLAGTVPAAKTPELVKA